jgi:hypothetical protein
MLAIFVITLRDIIAISFIIIVPIVVTGFIIVDKYKNKKK